MMIAVNLYICLNKHISFFISTLSAVSEHNRCTVSIPTIAAVAITAIIHWLEPMWMLILPILRRVQLAIIRALPRNVVRRAVPLIIQRRLPQR